MEKAKSKTILIIDDDAAFLEELHALLSEKNYNVVTCSNSEQALLMVRDYAPTMILLDLAMPSLTGEDLLHLIRMRHPHIPVMICTGVPNIDPWPLLENGATSVFQKPFHIENLFRAIDKAA